MRIDEFTNDKQKLELLKLIIDNVWASFEQETKSTQVSARDKKPLKPLQSKPKSTTKQSRKRKVVRSTYKRPPPLIPTWPKQPVKTDSDSSISQPEQIQSKAITSTNLKTMAPITKSPYKPYPKPYLTKNPYTA